MVQKKLALSQGKPWPADRVAFLNDVFFCVGDVVRLLSHEDADLACGMDFDRPRIAQMDRQVLLSMQMKYQHILWAWQLGKLGV